MRSVTASKLRPVAIMSGDFTSDAAHRLLQQGVALVIPGECDAPGAEALADTFRAGGRVVTIVGAPRPGAEHE
jgi:hypothetical protein